MSTVNITVTVADKWKEVVASGSGFFSASKSCQYCFAQSQPADTFYGHRLSNLSTETYLLPTLEKMYTKADQDMVFVLTGE